jgi:hypothetical protein
LSDDALGLDAFGERALVATRYGARFPTAPHDLRYRTAADESHRDQCLACFAELGVPLSHALTIEGSDRSLRDVLADSIATFDPSQRELEWTAIAYAFYVPPRVEWTNRFGQEFSFDDLSLSLMARPLERRSCGGAHCLQALSDILKADAEHAVLSQAVRDKARRFVEGALCRMLVAQGPDGSWDFQWAQGLVRDSSPAGWSREPNAESVLLATGHVAELMIRLPADFRLRDSAFERAIEWIRPRIAGLDREGYFAAHCPWTHAIAAVVASGSPTVVPASK